MPVHDWTCVTPGVFHAFHNSWIGVIQDTLNNGLLPKDFYVLGEQVAGPFGPDVLALQSIEDHGDPDTNGHASALAVAIAPPRVRFTAQTEMNEYVLKQRTLVIRHSTDDRIIALIEILSPGNKDSRHAVRSFVTKAAEALYHGYHLLLIDLFPPSPRDPQGIHGAVWEEIGDDTYKAPPEKPLTLVAYVSDRIKTAYIEPIAVGDTLPDMPLFLEPANYVNVPLEATYQAAWHGVPQRWKRVLEAAGS